MVAMIESSNAEVTAAPRQWRKPVAIASAVVLIAVVAVGIAVWRHKDTYPAIRDAGFGGPYQDRSRALGFYETDLGTEIYLRGAVGTQAQWIFGITNDGSRDVTVLKPEPFAPMTNFQWSKKIDKEGGNAFGEDTPLRVFPATMGAHETIRVIVTIKKPNCGGDGGYNNVTDIEVPWRVGGSQRSKLINMFGEGQAFVPCPRFIK
jgi:hypothetical protein